jgi:molecular chaperone GrpE
MTEEKHEQKKVETAKDKAQQPAQPDDKKAANQIKELQEKLEAAIKEKDEIFARLQRVSADYANYQKRSYKQTTETVNYEREKIIKSLLPALDDLDRTLKNVEVVPDNHAAIIKGIKIVYDHIMDILKACGVERIKAVGEKFDPFLHQAISQAQVVGKAENIVLEESQKGYKVDGRVIRPSKVIVNKLSKAEPPREQMEKPDEAEETEPDETTDVEE